MNEEIKKHHSKYPYKYMVSSIESYWHIGKKQYIKYRLFWILTNEKSIVDMVWNNVKNYEGAVYSEF